MSVVFCAHLFVEVADQQDGGQGQRVGQSSESGGVLSQRKAAEGGNSTRNAGRVGRRQRGRKARYEVTVEDPWSAS